MLQYFNINILFLDVPITIIFDILHISFSPSFFIRFYLIEFLM